MARMIIHQLVDDIDGTSIGDGEGETVLFGLDGNSYEIELTTENADRLREALAPFISAGRSRGRASGSRGRTSGSRGRGSDRDLNEVRRWARENGFSVADRGRVPVEVEKAYAAR
ncbi:histone-like nucleoid-structuring protein Lsr2 [Microbacterium maritypicum]|uniref:histone-like nucleoid-structuring protein Lsr2 n=1 Tax=Microbacterium maritypicum TaxID=33918 RepID=UPI003805D08A